MATITIQIDTDREEDVRDLALAVEQIARLVTFQTVVTSTMHPAKANEVIITQEDDGTLTVGVWEEEEEGGSSSIIGMSASITLKDLIDLIDGA